MTKIMTSPTGSQATKRIRKQQADRLLKQLPLSDRRRQQQIREQIARDFSFTAT